MQSKVPLGRTRTAGYVGARGLILALAIGLLLIPAAQASPLPPAPTVATSRHSVFLPLVAGGSGAVQPPAASSQELILAALRAGTIDRGTALLYRAYALYGDPRLPTAFVGAGPAEDAGLMAEAEDPALAPAVRAALKPFLVRPTDPASVFSARRQGAASTAGLAAGGACEGGWVSSATAGIRVWAECAPGLASDPEADAVVAEGVALADKLWGPMTALMGSPVPDMGTPEAGGDDKIDIYIVYPLSKIGRDGGTGIPGYAGAAAFKTAPCPGETCSGFIMLNRYRLGSPSFYSTMVHEFFHVLSFAHNAEIGFRCVELNGCALNQWKEYWFVEASAVWAESYFVPETAGGEVHFRFTDDFQPSRLPLHASLSSGDAEWSHMYGAYIWPYFMQQIGGPAKIADAWKAIGQIDTWLEATDAIDAQLPFDQYFRAFALRNYNRELLPGDPLPRESRYVSVDPFSNFPDNRPPPDLYAEVLGALPPQEPYVEELELASLSASYHHFKFELDSVQQVTIDVGGLLPADSLDVDALVRIDGQWSLRTYSGSERITFCTTNPAERLQELVLVLSNHNKDLDATISGPLEIAPLAQPCAAELVGSLTWSQSLNASSGGGVQRDSGTATVQLRMRYDAQLDAYIDAGSTFGYSGTHFSDGTTDDGARVTHQWNEQGGGTLGASELGVFVRDRDNPRTVEISLKLPTRITGTMTIVTAEGAVAVNEVDTASTVIPLCDNPTDLVGVETNPGSNTYELRCTVSVPLESGGVSETRVTGTVTINR